MQKEHLSAHRLSFDLVKDEQVDNDLKPVGIDQVKHKMVPCFMDHAFQKSLPFTLKGGLTYTALEIDGISCYGSYTVPLETPNGVANYLLYPETNLGHFEQLFVPGQPLTGHYITVGEKPADVLLVTEDFIFAQWLHERFGYSVAASLFAENTEPVCQTLKTLFPDVQLIVVTSDSQHSHSLAVQTIMRKAAETNDAKFAVVPDHNDFELTDTKDFKDATYTAIATAVIPRSEMEIAPTSQSLVPRPPIPWSYPVNGHGLLQHMIKTIKKYVSMSTEEIHIAVLWVFFTYLIDVFEIAPILAACSPEKRCGKTTFLDVVMRMVYRPLSTSSLTPAALYRITDRDHPTLGIDEADTFLPNAKELQGIINSGYTRIASKVYRSGKGNETAFDTFCPKLVAMIGTPSGPIGDRSIMIMLRRKSTSEILERLRHAKELDFIAIRSQLMKWANDNKSSVKNANPTVPKLSSDRAMDNFEPLLMIASCIGPVCLNVTIDAIFKLEEVNADNRPSVGEMLLRDIQIVLKNITSRFIPTKTLVNSLCLDSEKSWATYDKGRPMTPRQLAELLSNYRIKSKDFRHDGRMLKSYAVADFNDAFDRYVPRE